MGGFSADGRLLAYGRSFADVRRQPWRGGFPRSSHASKCGRSWRVRSLEMAQGSIVLALTQHVAARSGAMLPGSNGPINRTIGQSADRCSAIAP